MALKPDRVEHLTDLSFFMNETGERGKVVFYDTAQAGSGAAMDNSNQRVVNGTGDAGGIAQANYLNRAAGILLNDVVNLDLTRQHLNFHKDEVQLGSKVLLLKRGTVVTNAISGTPAAANIGQPLYVTGDGFLGATASANGGPRVGRLLSIKDADGYCKVDIDVTW